MPEMRYLEAWPSLMTDEMAARYLSLEVREFRAAMSRSKIAPVEVADECCRWRKADLDRFVKLLPNHAGWSNQSLPVTKLIRLDERSLRQLADFLTTKLEALRPYSKPELLTIRDAMATLRVSRSTIYRLINEGQLEKKQVGGRSLVSRSSITLLLG